MQVTGFSVRYSLFVFFLLSSLLAAQKHPNKEVDSLFSTGINQILLQEYENARSTFKSLIVKYPELPLGDILYAGAIATEEFDFKAEFSEDKIDSLFDAGLEKSEELLDKNENYIWYIYYTALTKGYNAYFRGLKEDYIYSFTEGYRAIQYYRKCLEIDSTFYEAYISIGSYLYWSSVKTESISWLPFITDEKEKGIQMLQDALEKTSYHKYSAAYSLIWIYIEEKEYEKAIAISDKMLALYPGNRLFLEAAASAYQRVDLEISLTLHEELLNSYLKIGRNIDFHKINNWNVISDIYFKMKKYDTAIEYCDKVLKLFNELQSVNSKLEGIAERVEKRKEKILEEMKQ